MARCCCLYLYYFWMKSTDGCPRSSRPWKALSAELDPYLLASFFLLLFRSRSIFTWSSAAGEVAYFDLLTLLPLRSIGPAPRNVTSYWNGMLFILSSGNFLILDRFLDFFFGLFSL
jgi:hypothetical protein